MQIIYILYWGGESGAREDCSIFYTESKAYTTKGAAIAAGAQCAVDNGARLAAEDEDAIEDGFYTHIVECELF